MLKTRDFTKETAIALIQSWFAGLAKVVEDEIPLDPVKPYLSAEKQRLHAKAVMASLQQQQTSRNYQESGDAEWSLVPIARDLLAQKEFDFDELPRARKLDIFDGLARAYIEQQRLLLHRLDDRLAPFYPTDLLFDESFRGPVRTQHFEAAASPAELLGPSVGEAIAAYLKHGKKIWATKTYVSRQVRLGYLREYLGADKPLASVNPHDVRGFRDAICCLRARRGSGAQSFLQKQTASEQHRISSKTATLIFEPCKAFLRWAKSHEGYITTNPAEDVKVTTGKQPKAVKSRRSMTADELTSRVARTSWRFCAS